MTTQKVNQIQTVSYFALIEKVGSHGRYQIIISIAIILQWFVIGAVLLGPSLIFLSSSPVCPDIIPTTTCQQYVCTQPQSEWGQYYPNRVDSLRYAFGNILICNKTWIVSLMQSMVYIGAFFSNLIYSYLPDNYGRKFAYVVSWGTSCIGLIILCVSWHIAVAGIGLFLVGLGMDGTTGISFMILYQQVKQKPRQYYGILTQIAFCFGGIAISGVFFVLQSWRFLAIYTFTIPALLGFASIYFLEENPKFILKKSGIEKTLESLRRIAKMNGISGNIVSIQDIEKVKQQQQIIDQKAGYKVTLKDALKYKSVRIPTLFSTFVGCCLLLLYYGPVLIIQQIGLDPLVNQAILTFSELITYPVSFIIITSARRKFSGILTFCICGIITGILIFLKEPEICQLCRFQYIQLGLVCFSRFFLCLYFTIFMLYSMELIPQAARGVSSGLSGIIARIFTFLNPFIIQLFDDQNWNIMIVFTGAAIVGIIMMIPLNQTLNKPIMEQIPQLNEQKQKQALISKQQKENINTTGYSRGLNDVTLK